MTRVWEKMLNVAIEKLGEGTREELEERLGPVANEIQREQLRKRVEGYGLDE